MPISMPISMGREKSPSVAKSVELIKRDQIACSPSLSNILVQQWEPDGPSLQQDRTKSASLRIIQLNIGDNNKVHMSASP